MLKELEEIFGKFDENEENWIKDNLRYFTESDKVNFMKYLKDNLSGTNGKPDIELLAKVLTKVTGKKQKTYAWAVCMECHGEYDYSLPICPHCYDKGLECRALGLKTSDIPPNSKVIRYNKPYLGNGSEPVCYGCEHREMSFCRNFGNPNWNCQMNEYEVCECKVCCAKSKKMNRDRIKTDESKITYAVPLKIKGVSNGSSQSV